MSRPIVFCTDYGLRDEFVGVCHGVMFKIAPDASVIDLTHAVPREDVMRGALVLSRAAPYLPDDAVYCAVVDPGVGSERRAVGIRAGTGASSRTSSRTTFGFASRPSLSALPIARRHSPTCAAASRVSYWPAPSTSASSRARRPSSAHVSPMRRRRRPCSAIGTMVAPDAIGALVIGVDGFGNVQLNVTREHLVAAGIEGTVGVAGSRVPLVETFTNLPEHGLGVIVDSQGFVALVVNKGSAAELLHLGEGSTVVLE